MYYCKDSIMNITGYLHILSIIITVFGTFKHIESIKNNKPHSIWLSATLAIMLLLRIPNQVCIAFSMSHGWYTVIGTIIGILSFVYLTYITYEKKVKKKK